MTYSKSILCISTKRPSDGVLSAAGGSSGATGGGSITLVDPSTGATFSSLRCCSDMAGKVPIGVNSLSIFPPPFSSNTNSTVLSLAFGQTIGKNKDDSYAMLVSLPGTSSTMVPPVLHWKTRLPEGNLTSGLSISPCGYYIVGGGHSGTLYVWTSVGGQLIRTTKAHYRAICVMTWTLCGEFLVTGGADGMVHVFSLHGLVELKDGSLSTGVGGGSVQPIRSWSNHQLPVHDIISLPGGRLATAGKDGQVLILEVCSEAVLATLQFPCGIQSLATSSLVSLGSTLFAGSVDGTIYRVSLDEYTIHKLQQEGAVAVSTTFSEPQLIPNKDTERNESIENDIYRTELIGHERAVTALSIYGSGTEQPLMLCSGDESGTIRLWDLEARSCVKTINPWVVGVATSDSSTAGDHPVSSIRVLELTAKEERNGMVGMKIGEGSGNQEHFSSNHKRASRKKAAATTIHSLVSPLQKFVESESNRRLVHVPFLSPPQCLPPSFWDVATDPVRDRLVHNRRRRKSPSDDGDDTERQNKKQSRVHSYAEDAMEKETTKTGKTSGFGDTTKEAQTSMDDQQSASVDGDKARIRELEKELAEARDTIQRWRTVNNKLIARLQQPQQHGSD